VQMFRPLRRKTSATAAHTGKPLDVQEFLGRHL
jgi:hypothetical protein